MASFQALAEFSSSVDGKVLIIKDVSTYLDNDQNYTRDSFTSRTVEIRYGDNDTVDVINFPYLLIGDDTITFSIDKDKWLDITLVLIADDDNVFRFNKHIGYNMLVRYKQYLLLEDKGCKSCSDDSNKVWQDADMLVQQAKFSGRAGDGLEFNRYIDLANKRIDLSCKC